MGDTWAILTRMDENDFTTSFPYSSSFIGKSLSPSALVDWRIAEEDINFCIRSMAFILRTWTADLSFAYTTGRCDGRRRSSVRALGVQRSDVYRSSDYRIVQRKSSILLLVHALEITSFLRVGMFATLTAVGLGFYQSSASLEYRISRPKKRGLDPSHTPLTWLTKTRSGTTSQQD